MDFTWSKSEKKIAQAAFDLALDRERLAIRREVEAMLRDATDDHVIWRVHDFLSKTRREFDEKYDYRYSVLMFVFARLIAEKRLTEADLAGLSPEKLKWLKGIEEFRMRDR